MEDTGLSLAAAIKDEITETFGKFEAQVAESRRFISEIAVPLLSELTRGLSADGRGGADLYVDDGINHATIRFGGRPAVDSEPLVPPVLRLGVASDGTLSLVYSASWRGDTPKVEYFAASGDGPDSAERRLWLAVFLFVSGADLDYRQRALIGRT